MKNTPSPVSSRRGLILATLLLTRGRRCRDRRGSPACCRRLRSRGPASAPPRRLPQRPSRPGGRPSLAISPEEGEPGTRIVAVGRGWRPGDTVLIRLEAPGAENATTQEMASAIVSDRGEFSARFTYPDNRPWDCAAGCASHSRRRNRAPTNLDVVSDDRRAAYDGDPDTHRDGHRDRVAAHTNLNPHRAAAAANVDAVSAATDHPTHESLPGRRRPHGRRPHRTAWPTAVPPIVVTGWRGEYFASINPYGQPALIRNDAAIDFNWGLGSPAARSAGGQLLRALAAEAGF